MHAVRALATTALLAVILVMGLLPAAAAPSAGGVIIKTIPKVPGFPVILDGKTVRTDKSGVARFDSGDRHNIENRITLPPDQNMELNGRQVRVSAVRVYPSGDKPQIALSIFYPVRFSFIDVNGEPIDVSRIESVELKSQTGESRKASAEEVVLLQGSRVVSLAGGPQNKEIQWAIQSVEYASSNVVNSAQQRFEPAHTEVVEIKLLFYRTKVTVKDAFFGFATGDAVLVTSPDGSVERFPLAENGTVSLPSLPRGDYSIVVEGPGPLMARPVAISRDQVLDLKFYSWLDIGIVVALLGTFALGTLWLGWRRRRAHSAVVEDESEAGYEIPASPAAPATAPSPSAAAGPREPVAMPRPAPAVDAPLRKSAPESR
jgi:hypothetical protein